MSKRAAIATVSIGQAIILAAGLIIAAALGAI